VKIPVSVWSILFYCILLPIHLYAGTSVQIEENTPSLKSFTFEYGENVTSFSDIDKDTVWKPTKNKVNFVPKKNYWYKISLHNATSSIQTRILFFTETNIEYINFYHKKEGVFVKERAGASIQPNQRSVDSHLSAFKMTLQPNETATFYVHIHSLLPAFEEIWLLSEQDHANYEKKSLLIYVAYFGILLTTLLYSLIVTITTKEKILAVNTLYLFFSLLWILLNSGLYLYFFPSYIGWRLSCSASISYVLLIEFAKFFIKIKEISIHLHRSVIALQLLLVLTAILSFWDMTLGISALVYVGFVVMTFLIMTALIFLFMPIQKIIKIYLILLLPLLSSLLVYLLAFANIIDPSYRYQYFYLFGSFIELNGFAMLSLFYILKMKKEKEKEKQELATLRENYTVRLEKEIMEKTETLYITNQELEKNLHYQATLMQEIHHRVKNNLQMVISIISLERLKSISEETDNILKNTIMRIQSISSIHEMLYASSDISSISLSDYSHNLIHSVRSIFDDTDVKIFISCNEQTIGMRDAINLGLIIVELISNSIKHNKNSKNLKIYVRINFERSKLSLFIKDNGRGFDIQTTDLSKSVGINLIRSIASSFNNSKYDFSRRKGMLFALTCSFD
jgi:two-component system, sensor histidine kinase LadS